MRSAGKIVYLVVTVAVLIAWACDSALAQTRQAPVALAESLKAQQQRLKDIDQLIAQETETIEAGYARDQAMLRRLAEDEARLLDYPTRAIWAEFFLNTNLESFADSYLFDTSEDFLPVRDAFELRVMLKDRYFRSLMADFLLDPDAQNLVAQIANDVNRPGLIVGQVPFPREETLVLRRAAKRLYRKMDVVRQEQMMLEKNRANNLAQLRQWAAETRADIAGLIADIEAQIGNPPPAGVIIAISFGPEDKLAMIDGQTYRQGDRIGNITILSIHRKKVEFESRGRRWTQGVGQLPAGDLAI